jgi:hypothetical protein
MSKKRTDDPFVKHTRSLLESVARRELTRAEYKCLDVIERELLRHGGKYQESGGVPIDYDIFIAYGVPKNLVKPALNGLEALGLIRITKPGRGGNAEHRQVGEYRITYAGAKDYVNNEVWPTHEWRQWEGKPEEAEQAVKEARAKKDPRAVAKGRKHYRGPRRADFKKVRTNIVTALTSPPMSNDWMARHEALDEPTEVGDTGEVIRFPRVLVS